MTAWGPMFLFAGWSLTVLTVSSFSLSEIHLLVWALVVVGIGTAVGVIFDE